MHFFFRSISGPNVTISGMQIGSESSDTYLSKWQLRFVHSGNSSLAHSFATLCTCVHVHAHAYAHTHKHD